MRFLDNQILLRNANKTVVGNYDYGLPMSTSQAAAAASSVGTGTSLAGVTTSRKVGIQQASAVVKVDSMQQAVSKPAAPLTSRPHMNGSTVLRRPDAVPVIRTRLERPVNARRPLNAQESLQHIAHVLLSSFSILKKSDPTRFNKYVLSGVDEGTVEQATAASAHGNSSAANGVQRILVDPDKPSAAYASYVEQVRNQATFALRGALFYQIYEYILVNDQ
ncbi:unnamed protein product [Gongylonema pulchrum]|uniref:Uncharacterized protein n=1 Tax=Gongylonema pulchrum TaxID=637853 RepID=A0A183D416_9BILA|nr:unnamed protein product [Gongylonema pulchrum]